MGPFFWRLAKALRRKGAQVFKINFCGGDELFYPVGSTGYRGEADAWPAFLNEFIDRHRIDALMLFGDCRSHHAVATRIARDRGLSVYVFEEGYLRPDFVTVEPAGANSFSTLPRDPEVYRRFSAHPASRSRAQRVRHAFGWAGLYAALYTLALAGLRRRYPHYRHHRPLRPGNEILVWTRAFFRKLVYRWQERGVLDRLTRPGAQPYYLVPLQVQGDAQVSVHSRFGSVPAFMETVLESFARHAPPEVRLVLKHHPLDRGYNDYARLIAALAASHGLGGRISYVHDVYLPRLLERARGTVVINSTVGLSSVHHGTPVHVLGNAIYKLPGLVHDGSLDDFWREPGRPDASLYRAFRAWLRAYNQANGSFYAPLKGCAADAGLRWPPLFPPPTPATADVPLASAAPQTVSM